MHKSWKRVAGSGLFLMFCMTLISCSTPAVQPESEQMTSQMKTILVLPFHDVSKLYESDTQVRCYLCGQIMNTGSVPDTASPFLTSRLIEMLEKIPGYTIMSSEGSEDLLTGLSGSDNGIDPHLNMYINAGIRAGADGVLIGHIFRFVDRKGNRASVISPASVAFDLHLIDVRSKKIIWTGHFDQTQKPLSDNLLDLGTFIKRKASWVTADELAEGGLEDIMKRFPKP